MDVFDKVAFDYSNGDYTLKEYEQQVRLLELHEKGVAGAGNTPFGFFRAWYVAPFTKEDVKIKGIVVAHEMDWVDGERSYRQYSSGYEAIQQKFGVNLKFICKERSLTMGRILVRYDFEDDYKPGLLFTPATGEEIYFEIYGIDERYGVLRLMWTSEA